MKYCNGCKKDLDDKFFKPRGDGKPGLRSRCKGCLTKQDRQYASKRYSNAVIKKGRNYFKNLELKKKYNLTLDEYNEFYRSQNGCCQICEKKFDVLNVDHDHTTNKIRGLLCMHCNQALRKFQDSIKYLENAKNYLLRSASG